MCAPKNRTKIIQLKYAVDKQDDNNYVDISKVTENWLKLMQYINKLKEAVTGVTSKRTLITRTNPLDGLRLFPEAIASTSSAT